MAIPKLTPGTPGYTFDDIASDLQHLFDLTDTVVEFLVEIDRGNIVRPEKTDLDRATSLAWILRDQLENMKERALGVLR
jgi:hypothetical protein